MPMYEFECLECGNEFEALVLRSGEKDEVKCPDCGSPKLEEKISSFASGPKSGNCAPSGG
jgi:putative FmdB family regulatory protein